jgi:hypothetical protein
MDTATNHDIRAIIGVKNSGNTPAEVLGYDVTLVHGIPLDPNPERPPIPSGPPLFSLMPRSSLNIWQNFPMASSQLLQEIRQGAIEPYLIGWVVYRDRFGNRHRSGYGRQYMEAGTANGNNLVFVLGSSYNYEEDLD